MNPIDTRVAVWIKSSYSGGNQGECLEFAPNLAAHGRIPVRDSKNPTGPALVFTPAAWVAFTAALR
ncbi:DUF397 domain-containing protein [Streptomyces cinnamoneus]|uniref:DUF397 domain-containing protein n=1 Tax=Streptomyces cinnamoneus TaxID=53446 RepID=UPI00340C418A